MAAAWRSRGGTRSCPSGRRTRTGVAFDTVSACRASLFRQGSLPPAWAGGQRGCARPIGSAQSLSERSGRALNAERHAATGCKTRIRGASFARGSRSATRMSYSDCRFSQSRGSMPKNIPSQSAVSAVMGAARSPARRPCSAKRRCPPRAGRAQRVPGRRPDRGGRPARAAVRHRRGCLAHPTDHGATQARARVAREAGVGAIMYASVRDPRPARCVALLDPSGFARAKPRPRVQTRFLAVSDERPYLPHARSRPPAHSFARALRPTLLT